MSFVAGRIELKIGHGFRFHAVRQNFFTQENWRRNWMLNVDVDVDVESSWLSTFFEDATFRWSNNKSKTGLVRRTNFLTLVWWPRPQGHKKRSIFGIGPQGPSETIFKDLNKNDDAHSSFVWNFFVGISYFIRDNYTNANLFFDKKKKGTSANLRPSFHFYGMIFWLKKGLCIGMAWLLFQKYLVQSRTSILLSFQFISSQAKSLYLDRIH